MQSSQATDPPLWSQTQSPMIAHFLMQECGNWHGNDPQLAAFGAAGSRIEKTCDPDLMHFHLDPNNYQKVRC